MGRITPNKPSKTEAIEFFQTSLAGTQNPEHYLGIEIPEYPANPLTCICDYRSDEEQKREIKSLIDKKLKEKGHSI